MLSLEAVSSGYGRMQVLEDTTLRVEKGEIVSLLGPNGAGKTTLLNTIYGLAQVLKGKVTFEGSELNGLKPEQVARRGIGYSPQMDSVFPSLTVRDNLELGGFIRRDNLVEDMDEMLKLFPELERRKGNLAKTLSGGERQMLAVARALMARPRLLLLDEPTAGLSPKALSMLFNKILEIKSKGITMLLVEQNAKRALGISDRAYVLVGGRIVAEASGKEMLSDDRLGQLYFGKT
jgi:branched-chain amino acid transport system ATP-binding protein